MGAAMNFSSGNGQQDRSESSEASAATTDRLKGQSLTYQVILRHLAKFRDAATTVLDLFATHAPAESGQPEFSAPMATAVPGKPEAEPKTPLEWPHRAAHGDGRSGDEPD